MKTLRVELATKLLAYYWLMILRNKISQIKSPSSYHWNTSRLTEAVLWTDFNKKRESISWFAVKQESVGVGSLCVWTRFQDQASKQSRTHGSSDIFGSLRNRINLGLYCFVMSGVKIWNLLAARAGLLKGSRFEARPFNSLWWSSVLCNQAKLVACVHFKVFHDCLSFCKLQISSRSLLIHIF